MRRCWRREEVQESQGPRVPRSRGPKVPGSQGSRYLKLTFKYELDSKEGPSCFNVNLNNNLFPLKVSRRNLEVAKLCLPLALSRIGHERLIDI